MEYRAQATLGEPLENFIALAKRDPERAAEHIKALEEKLVRALDQNRGAVEALDDLLRAFVSMPDAGLTANDPRYAWWYETADVRDRARQLLGGASQ